MSDLSIPESYLEQITENYISKSKVNDILQHYDDEYDEGGVIPAVKNDVFKALELTKFETVRVVILGQDPYPNAENAMGLAFSSRSKVRPKSLKNIVKELKCEYNSFQDNGGNDLSYWANQGVLLLNTILTFKPSESDPKKNLHKSDKKKWKDITDAIIRALDDYSKKERKPIVFMLWGEDACITGCRTLLPKSNEYRLVLTATHPSEQGKREDSRCAKKFEDCGHFKKANDFLVKYGVPPIDWSVINLKECKRLLQDKLLILEHCWGSQENVVKLIEECKNLLDSNKPDNIKICIDILYREFENHFKDGELLSKMSDLIKDYKIARLTPKDFTSK